MGSVRFESIAIRVLQRCSPREDGCVLRRVILVLSLLVVGAGHLAAGPADAQNGTESTPTQGLFATVDHPFVPLATIATKRFAGEVIGPGHAAFAVNAILPGGRRVYKHVILHLRAARIARQVDVEA
jgi:hypothetical protein